MNSDVSMLPRVGPFSTIKLRRPVKMVETDQAGFHVSGWKSVIERHNLQKVRQCGLFFPFKLLHIIHIAKMVLIA